MKQLELEKPKTCVCGQPATDKLGELDVCKRCFDADRNFGIRPKRKATKMKAGR